MEIWKAKLKVQGTQYVSFPQGAEFLSVMMQAGSPTLWAKVDPSKPLVDRRIVMVGTGHSFDDSDLKHLATVLDGPYVWHFFREG